jgi:hypothetical protein
MIMKMVTRIVGPVLLLVENADPPSDFEWDDCLTKLAEFRPDFTRVRVLVITDGGGPTQPQRKRLSALAEGHPMYVAVVSESMKVRFIVSSVALFLREIASFRQNELDQAYDHLQLDSHIRFLADRAILEMGDQVGIKLRPVPSRLKRK